MVLGIVPTFAVSVFAQNTATGNAYYYSYYEDFEDFTTDMDTEKIVEKLGWSDWDFEVADLCIVETVWVREVYAETGKTCADMNNADAALLNWDEGNNYEKGSGHNRIADIAVLDNTDYYGGLTKNDGRDLNDKAYSDYVTYSKKLLVVPKKADANISAVMATGISTDTSALFMELEMTPNKATSYGWEKGNNATVDYSTTSSIGIGLNFDTGAKYSQSWGVLGELIYFASDPENGTNLREVSPWSAWYSGNAQKYNTQASGVTLGGTSDSYRYTNTADDESTEGIDESIVNYYIYDSNGGANGFTFDIRTKLNLNNNANLMVQPNYLNPGNAGYTAANALNSWSSYGSVGASGVASAMNNIYTDATSADATLEIYNSGVSFYLDNISFGDTNGKNNSPTMIKVNGENRIITGTSTTYKLADLVNDDEQFIYGKISEGAITTDINTEFTVASNMEITLRTVSISARYGASMRLSNPTGLRWTTDINLEDLKALNDDANISNLKVGTLITLTENLANTAWGELTVGTDVIDVAADLDALKSETAKNGMVSFNGSIVNIKDENLDKAFSGIGYISMTVNGETVVIYSNYTAESDSRTVRYIAQAALADVLTEADKKEHAEGDKYEHLLAVGEKYVVISGDSVNTATVGENDAVYSRYNKDERNVLLRFYGQ